MSKTVKGAPGWARSWLRDRGMEPRDAMRSKVAEWWAWYAASADFYSRADWAMVGRDVRRVMTLRPAAMACEEMASLVMDDRSVLHAADRGCAEMLAERFGRFVPQAADDVALAFALGTGAWALDFDREGGVWRGRVTYYDAGQLIPLETRRGESVSCAFVSAVDVGGRRLDQLQVHAPDPGTGRYVVETHLFDRRHDEVSVEGVEASLDTGQTRPTYAIVRPSIANRYEDCTPMGVSIFADALDAAATVDQAFDGLAWALRLCEPRVMVDESAFETDPATGRMSRLSDAVDARMYRAMRGGVGEGFPVTVYNPDMQMAERESALNAALSLFSAKCGFGPNYFSYSRQAGLRTATEVVSDNSALYRNVKRHEAGVGESISRLLAGLWSAECALNGRGEPPDPRVEVQWDDSVVEDTAAERALMKDDIARGLCPAHLYPMRYYGLSEEDARALVGGDPLGEE